MKPISLEKAREARAKKGKARNRVSGQPKEKISHVRGTKEKADQVPTKKARRSGLGQISLGQSSLGQTSPGLDNVGGHGRKGVRTSIA